MFLFEVRTLIQSPDFTPAKQPLVKCCSSQSHQGKEHCDPPELAEESKPCPAQKVKKESPGESLGESPRVPADPPKRVKNGVSGVKKQVIFASQSLQKTRFRLVLGGRPGPSETPQRLPRRLFFDFLSRGGFWLLCQVGGVAKGTTYTSTSPSPFSKTAMQWAKNGRCQWICLFSL